MSAEPSAAVLRAVVDAVYCRLKLITMQDCVECCSVTHAEMALRMIDRVIYKGAPFHAQLDTLATERDQPDTGSDPAGSRPAGPPGGPSAGGEG